MEVETKALDNALKQIGYLLPGGRRQSPSVAISWGSRRLTLAACGVGGLFGLVALPVSASEHVGPVTVPYRSLLGVTKAWPSEIISFSLSVDRLNAIDTASTLKCGLPLLAPTESAFSDTMSPRSCVKGLSAAVLQIASATKAKSVSLGANKREMVIEATGVAYASTAIQYSGRPLACEVIADVIKRACKFIGAADAKVGVSDGRLIISTNNAFVSLPLVAESAVIQRSRLIADCRASEPWALTDESIGALSRRVKGNPTLTLRPNSKTTRALVMDDGQSFSELLPGLCPAISCSHSALRLALLACSAPTIHSDSQRVYVCDGEYVASTPIL